MQGYIDAKLLYASSLKSGKLIARNFHRGDSVQIGDVLFELDPEPEKTALALGKEKVENIKSGLIDPEKEQSKPSFDQTQLESSEADLNKLQWEYDQKKVKSSVAGTLFDYYYEVGENVPSYKPVLSILYPEEIRAIFYVSEPELTQLKVGEKVKILCDGCGNDLIGTISFISPIAEYTPPVIYSVDRRSELVFRVEAKFNPNEISTIHMGLPIEVELVK